MSSTCCFKSGILKIPHTICNSVLHSSFYTDKCIAEDITGTQNVIWDKRLQSLPVHFKIYAYLSNYIINQNADTQ